MDGVDCDWCLVCEKHTAEGETYCSDECRSRDLMSSSASSTSSTSSSGSAYFNYSNSSSPSTPSFPSYNCDNYPMPPFVRKQRTSIPNIYAQCTSNANPPSSLMFTIGGTSALSHHILQQQQQQQQPQKQHLHGDRSDNHLINHHSANPSAATPYPLFYATLNALRPSSPSGS